MATDKNIRYMEMFEHLAPEDFDNVTMVLGKSKSKNLKTLRILYLAVRKGTIIIHDEKTKDTLLLYLSDLMVEQIGEKKNSSFGVMIGVLCIVTAIFLCIALYFAHEMEEEQEQAIHNIQEIYHGNYELDDLNEYGNTGTTPDGTEDETVHTSIYGLEALRSINPDLYGWMQIAGTTVDYPIVQGSDNEYYVSHDFYKNESSSGCLFLDYRNNSLADTNLIVYGHNIRSGDMFGSLKKYEEYEYFKKYDIIYVETLNEAANYRIIAVCKGKVAYEDEEGFRYYNFISANSKLQMEEFWKNIKTHSLHPVTYEFQETDQYLTLSTCSSFTENGRLYIIAVRED